MHDKNFQAIVIICNKNSHLHMKIFSKSDFLLPIFPFSMRNLRLLCRRASLLCFFPEKEFTHFVRTCYNNSVCNQKTGVMRCGGFCL